MARFKAGLAETPHPKAAQLVEQLVTEGSSHRDIAVSLASLLLEGDGRSESSQESKRPLGNSDSDSPRSREPRPLRGKNGKERKVPLTYTADELGHARPLNEHPEVVMERFWLAVGRKQGVQAREIVGSIANEAGIEGQFIGSINIFENYSTVDLPEGMPKPILKHLKKTRVKGTNLGIVRVVDSLSA